MTILGIGGILDAAATAIVKDGQLAAAVEEAKITRRHRVGALPEASIASCLSLAGAKPEDVAADEDAGTDVVGECLVGPDRPRLKPRPAPRRGARRQARRT